MGEKRWQPGPLVGDIEKVADQKNKHYRDNRGGKCPHCRHHGPAAERRPEGRRFLIPVCGNQLQTKYPVALVQVGLVGNLHPTADLISCLGETVMDTGS